MKNSNIDVRGDEAVGWELHSQRALVKGDWKIYYSGAETADWELYNLIKDPGEQEDLSNRYPDLKKDLIKQWFNYADEVGVAFE